jgi:hypothetical protein
MFSPEFTEFKLFLLSGDDFAAIVRAKKGVITLEG